MLYTILSSEIEVSPTFLAETLIDIENWCAQNCEGLFSFDDGKFLFHDGRDYQKCRQRWIGQEIGCENITAD